MVHQWRLVSADYLRELYFPTVSLLLALASVAGIALTPLSAWAGIIVQKLPFSDVPLEDAVRKDMRPLLLRARDTFYRGDPDGALAMAEEVAKNSKDAVSPRVYIARLFFSAGRFSAGKAVLERAAIDNPNDPDVYWSFAELAITEGRWTDAWVLYEKAAELLSDRPFSNQGRQIRMTQYLTGKSWVAEARKDWRLLENTGKQWLKLQPDSRDAMRVLARARFELKDVDAARQLLTQAHTGDAAVEPPSLLLSSWAEARGDTTAAKVFLEESLARFPRHPAVRLAAARQAAIKGNRAAVLDHVDAALGLKSDSLESLHLKTMTLIAEDRITDALATAREAVALSPSNIRSRELLAESLGRSLTKQKQNQGLEIARSIIRENPARGMAWATLGRIQLAHGNSLEAEQSLRRAMSTGTADAMAAYSLAKLLALKRSDSSTSEVQQLLQLATKTSGIFLMRPEAIAWLAELEAPD